MCSRFGLPVRILLFVICIIQIFFGYHLLYNFADDSSFLEQIYEPSINNANYLSLYDPSNLKSSHIEEYWFKNNVKQQLNTKYAPSIILPDNNVLKHRKVKAALVLLIRNKAIHLSLKRLQLMTIKVCKFFLKYPIYILTDHYNYLNISQKNEINEFIKNGIHQNIQIIDITSYWQISSHYVLSSDYRPHHGSYEMKHGINYRIMCYFHTSVIFTIPQINELDYYMRMDDDSELICTNGNYKSDSELPDIFEYMFNKKYIYGYWKTQLDPYDWTRNFVPFILDYKQRNNLNFTLDVPRYMKLWDEKGILPQYLVNQTVPMFYNNWEINYVPYFRSKAVTDFNKAIILQNGHFLYRWGDAPIRYFQIALFANVSNLLCLQDSLWKSYFSYIHKKEHTYRSRCDILFDFSHDNQDVNKAFFAANKKIH